MEAAGQAWVLWALMVMAGCAEHAAPAAQLSGDLSFAEAAARASDGLVAQAKRLPAFRLRPGAATGVGAAGSAAAAGSAVAPDGAGARVAVVPAAEGGVAVAPMREAGTGQQTAATEQLAQQVVERLRERLGGIDILPFGPADRPAPFLLTGSLTRPLPGDAGPGGLRIDLALIELRSGRVVAQASALARGDGDDSAPPALPLAHEADNPVVDRSAAVDALLRTSRTPAGRPADRAYLDGLATARSLAAADRLYDAGDDPAALAGYQAGEAQAGRDRLALQEGRYRASSRLGRATEAEHVYARIVADALARGRFATAFLFKPGSTVFTAGPAYPMWLREIGRQVVAAKVCIEIVGHVSRTGSEAADDRLSLQRAAYIRQRLIGAAAALAVRSQASGRGHRDNIVGSGSDDPVDAFDRRIEFKVLPCR